MVELPKALKHVSIWGELADVDHVLRHVDVRGVRTRGTAGNDRHESYGATDLRRITHLSGTWRGEPLGALSRVAPEPGFGFGSTPERPSVTSLVTTIDIA